nr:sec-independent protein translocase protein TATA, chloroplastic-like [Ipomoea batatas]GMD45237.1 sec-independent protein translocase protein TATA, chloroplastic-like [Ipomoea batatas]
MDAKVGGSSSEVEVTWEDQQKINKFSRLNTRFHELEDEIKVAKAVGQLSQSAKIPKPQHHFTASLTVPSPFPSEFCRLAVAQPPPHTTASSARRTATLAAVDSSHSQVANLAVAVAHLGTLGARRSTSAVVPSAFYNIGVNYLYILETCENMEDASNELILTDEEVVRFQIGEVFAHVAKEEVENRIEEMKEVTSKKLEKLEEEKESVVAQMGELKKRAALRGSRSSGGRKRFSCNCLFGLGVPELVVIAGVAALVFGPKKLPEVGRSIGKTFKGFQQAAKEFETELKKEPDSLAQAPSEGVEEINQEEKRDATVSSTKEDS